MWRGLDHTTGSSAVSQDFPMRTFTPRSVAEDAYSESVAVSGVAVEVEPSKTRQQGDYKGSLYVEVPHNDRIHVIDQFGLPYEPSKDPLRIAVKGFVPVTQKRPSFRNPAMLSQTPGNSQATHNPSRPLASGQMSPTLAHVFMGSQDNEISVETRPRSNSDPLLSGALNKPGRESFDFEGGTIFPGEPVPATAHYGENAVAIPSLRELMKDGFYVDKGDVVDKSEGLLDYGRASIDSSRVSPKIEESNKFGLWMGVVVQCAVTIFSVIVYVRMGWIVTQAGIGLTTLIILISTLVTVLTTLSLSAIATNGEAKGGGIYFMMSRALGPEFGGTIGVIYAFASATYVALNIVGFAEALVEVLPFDVSPDGSFDVRFWSLLTVTALVLLVFLGVEAVLKFQLAFVAIIGASVLGYFIGTFYFDSEKKGITGYSSETFSDNFTPSFTDNNNFFTIFGVFFPSVTGIMTGSNMSGELKNPRRDIPRGELIAILITSSLYILYTWTLGSVAAAQGTDSNSGLLDNLLIMRDLTIWEPLFYLGLFSASLSSAVGSLITAPRVFQAICQDGLFPSLKIFGEGMGPRKEPVYATLLAFAVSIAFILINDLNVISTLVTLFFLISYGIVNYACFVASASRSPGWRPAFRYFHPLTALLGCGLTVAVMFLIEWRISLAVLSLVIAMYYYLVFKSPDVNWGSARSAKLYVDTLEMSYKLQAEKKHVKNFRPQLLVLTGSPYERVQMIKFCSQITGNGVMILEHILLGDFGNRREEFNEMRAEYEDYLTRAKISAFYDVCVASSYQAGLRSMLQLSGLGGIRPNTVVMGWKHHWTTANQKEIDEYVGMIFDAFEFNFGVVAIRDHEELYDFRANREKRIDVWWLADDGGTNRILLHNTFFIQILGNLP
eukprot:TRINITY_DN1400_c0_g1_i3.p1 TRINITY_DN1400_c0_g1~~TRINITY_DN1400_c0_g1_i3.p1  ORF type:complete len:895 (-),score=153.82 TRINITY_DN1400_c0_g1_i3:576-3260(-)